MCLATVMESFRKAVESGDADALIATLAEDVEFRSPAVHKPYVGRDQTGVILRAVTRVFEDFRYTHTYEGPDGWVLVFEARVGDKQVQGADFVHANDEGLVDALTVMIRPLSGLNAVVTAMGAEIEKILDELSAH